MSAKIQLSLFIFALSFFMSCKTSQMIHSSSPGNELFKVAILYPTGEDKTFDIEYYETKHMPLVAGFLGENLKFYEIDKGVGGRTPNDKAPFVAIGYFYVQDVAEYHKAIGANRDAVINDIKNYTNIQPMIQISEVRRVAQREKK